MAFEDSKLLCKITYFIRHKYYRTASSVILDGIKRYGNEPMLKLFNSICSIYENQLQDAIRELHSLSEINEVGIAALLLLAFAEKRQLHPDQQMIQELETKMRERRKQAGELALYFSAMVTFLTERYEKSREYIERALKLNAHSRQYLNLHGWIDLLCGRDAFQKKAVRFFEDANNKENGKNIDAMMGKAKFLELQANHANALEVINQVIVANSSLLPALLEKMRIQLTANHVWDEVIETADRCLLVDSNCIEAMKFKILKILSNDGSYEEAAAQINDLQMALDKTEPKNLFQYDFCARLFSRMCGRNALVLSQCVAVQQRTLKILQKMEINDASSAGSVPTAGQPNCQISMGKLLLLQQKPRDAIQHFQKALNQDQSSVQAIQGVIRCQIECDMLSEASTQLEFLHELRENLEKSAELFYLMALMSRKMRERQDRTLEHLDEAIQTHFAGMANILLSPEYYDRLNADLLLEIADEYFHFVPHTPEAVSNQTTGQHPVLRRLQQILDPLVKLLPGLQRAAFLLAKVHFLSGDPAKAEHNLKKCLESDPSFADAHLLMARIQMQMGNLRAAEQSLERSLSYDFSVRDRPIYHFLLGQLQIKQRNYADALKTFKMALDGSSSSAKQATLDATTNANANRQETVNRLSVYLEMVEAHTQMNQLHEAAKLLQDAEIEFGVSNMIAGGSGGSGTSVESVRIALANADLAEKRGDVEQALSILRQQIPGTEEYLTYFIEAHKRMAEIYLKKKKDPRLYTACYRELTEKVPSVDTWMMLGDAYMRIQQPDRAIQVYEEARRSNENDMDLATKMGKALIRTHDYVKAIKYYWKVVSREKASTEENGAGNDAGNTSLRYDLAELLMKVKKLEEARDCLQKGIEANASSNNWQSMQETAKLQYLLGQVLSQRPEWHVSALDTFKKAVELQAKVAKRAMVDQPEAIMQAKRFHGKIHVAIAKHYEKDLEYELAKQAYQEALSHNQSDYWTLLDLAKMLVSIGDLDGAQHECLTLMKLYDERHQNLLGSTTTNSENLAGSRVGVMRGDEEDLADEAALILAKLMMLRLEFDSAIFYVKSILEKKPDHWDALEMLISLTWRAGDLQASVTALNASQNSCVRSDENPNYQLCRAYYEWYCGNAAQALTHFNRARTTDFQLASRATLAMIEICLNPDDDVIGGEVFDSISGSSGADSTTGGGGGDYAEAIGSEEKCILSASGIKTAERLLDEMEQLMQQQPVDSVPEVTRQRVEFLRGMWLVASKQKTRAEQALELFAHMARDEPENVFAVCGSATACAVLKQSQKARNHLKRLSKYAWDTQFAVELEKSWLLLADIHISASRAAMAEELLNKCLQYNRSCCKAYEYLGLIKEKAHEFDSAADNYELAWKYSNRSNPAIGYKLAFCYLKSSRLVECINTCHLVLDQHPKYPRIRRDILDKARLSIRM